MELDDIKNRDDLRKYWQQAIWVPTWDAAAVEAVRQSLLPIAKKLELDDWQRYFAAMEGYFINYAESEARLAALIYWARQHRENIEDWLFVHSLFCLGVTSGKIKKNNDALQIYGEIVSSFKHNTDKDILIIVAKAIVNLAIKAVEFGDIPSNIKHLDTLRDIVKSNDAPALRELLAISLVNEGVIASNSGDLKSMEKLLAELRTLATAHTEQFLYKELARALFNFSIALNNAEKTTRAYQVCAEAEKLLIPFSDEETKSLREQVGISKNRLHNKLHLTTSPTQKPKSFGQSDLTPSSTPRISSDSWFQGFPP